jgi:hypothetical protein
MSGVSLALTWPFRLCLLRVLLCTSHCYSFPLSKHTGGGDTAQAFSDQSAYLQLTWEVGLPPSLVEFSSHRFLYKLSHSWLLGVPQLPPSPARPSLFIYSSGRNSPPPPSRSGHSTLFATGIYCSYCLLLSFSFFHRWGPSVQGPMLIWPRAVCGVPCAA